MSNPEERLVEINHLKKYFHVNKGLLHAVDDVSFYINKGETLGLVGESGCGKSTTGRTIIRLLEADSGEVNFHGENVLAPQVASIYEDLKKDTDRLGIKAVAVEGKKYIELTRSPDKALEFTMEILQG